MGSFKQCMQAVMITFIAVNTLAVGLRIWVRTKLMKVYGMDDFALALAYLGFLLGCGFGFTTIHFGFAADPGDDDTNFNQQKKMKYYAANQYCLYISSGIIKIAVALVLYRLACGLKSQVILVMSIIVIVIWTFITTIFAMDLCASSRAASYTGQDGCTAIGYFRMISNIFIDYFFALFPIPMLWAASLSRRMKVIVCCLLGLGFIASAATVAKLILLVQLSQLASAPLSPTTAIRMDWIHIQLLIWSDAELGLAIFTATLSGLRPLVRRIFGRAPARWSARDPAAAAAPPPPPPTTTMTTAAAAHDEHRGAYPRALAAAGGQARGRQAPYHHMSHMSSTRRAVPRSSCIHNDDYNKNNNNNDDDDDDHKAAGGGDFDYDDAAALADELELEMRSLGSTKASRCAEDEEGALRGLKGDDHNNNDDDDDDDEDEDEDDDDEYDDDDDYHAKLRRSETSVFGAFSTPVHMPTAPVPVKIRGEPGANREGGEGV